MNKYVVILLAIIGIWLLVLNGCKKKETDTVFINHTDEKGTVSDVDGNSYTTIGIGGQIWTVENLKTTKYTDGTVIASISDTATWRTFATGAQCVINNLTSVDSVNKYGRLYNWEAVNTGKLCPSGWHVPSENDWVQLEKYLIANGYNFDGAKDSNNNYVAKSLASTSGWDTTSVKGAVGNTDDSTIRNKTGFTALPTGYRDYGGKPYGIGTGGYWWSSTMMAGNGPYFCFIGYNLKSLENTIGPENTGFSVRCIKN